jgi:deazaflavin-dependent oxidoreductase (nitroreductase family)
VPGEAFGRQLSDAAQNELSAWGKVLLIETRGRKTARVVRTAVGFVEDADGSLLIAATEPLTNWALNLEADPRATVTLEDRSFSVTAEAIDGAARNAAIAALILKYGTPAERLGRGPVFRLRRGGDVE